MKADYDSIRERHAAKHNDRKLLSVDAARANRTPIDWDGYQPPAPRTDERRVVLEDYPLAELRDYIDWQPFFNAWEMKGRFPDILNNPSSGEAARKLYDDAQAMLDQIVEEKWLRANAVLGFFPANAVGDDVEVYTDDSRSEVLATLHHLRQQGEHRDGVPNRALADFVAPKDTGLADHVGAFAVTAGLGSEEKVTGVQGRARRLLRDPARVARRPAGRGVRRAAARAGAHRVLGLLARRGARQRGAAQGAVRRHPARPRATPPAPTTPRRRRSGSCSTSRTTPGSR